MPTILEVADFILTLQTLKKIKNLKYNLTRTLNWEANHYIKKQIVRLGFFLVHQEIKVVIITSLSLREIVKIYDNYDLTFSKFLHK